MTKLEDYASEPGKSAMDLVLFRYTTCAANTARSCCTVKSGHACFHMQHANARLMVWSLLHRLSTLIKQHDAISVAQTTSQPNAEYDGLDAGMPFYTCAASTES